MSTGGAIGIIGGSGLYELPGLTDVRWRRVRTPFGDPSDEYCVGQLGDRPVVFLPRHGRAHRLMPSELNFRANIWGLKSLGVEWVISVSAVGSMREEIHPLDLVIPDQFFDHTRRRISSFFGEGIVAHVGMADPVCAQVADALDKVGARGRGHGPPRWDLHLHRGPPVFLQGRVAHLPGVGRRRHRDDEHAGGQAGPRGRAVLCHPGPGHRLRRLARRARAGVRGGGGAEPPSQRGHRQGGDRARGAEAAQRPGPASAPGFSGTR